MVRAVECDPKQTPHGVNPALVLTLHPNGVLTIRPKRTRAQPVVSFNLARLYARGLGEMFT